MFFVTPTSRTNNKEMDNPSAKAKAALHYAIHALQSTSPHTQEVHVSPAYTAGLTELVYTKLVAYGRDMEAFAKHAKRAVVSVEDVKLCVRRQEPLVEGLQEFIEAQQRAKKKGKTRA